MSGKRAQKNKTNPGLVFVGLLVVFALIAAGVWSYTTGGWPFSTFLDNRRGNGKTLTIDTAQSLDSLDMAHNTSTAVDQALLGNVYETLVGRDSRNQVTPTGVASSWKISPDNLTYIFTLRSNAHFSNGHTLDSQDVVWSLQQIIEKQTAGHERLSRIDGVKGDGNTVTLTLSKADPTLLWSLSTRAGIIYDKEAQYDNAKNAVGSGPYTVKNFEPNKSLTLEANANYWRTVDSHASTVVLQTQTDPQKAAADVSSGKVDAIIPLNNSPAASGVAKAVETLKKTQDIKVATTASTHRWGIALNYGADSLFADQRSRQAYNLLLDRTSLIQKLGISAQPTAGPVASLDPGYKAFDTQTFNATEAQRLISIYNIAYKRNLTLVYPADCGERIASLVSEQMSQAGGSVTPQALTPEQWKSQVIEGKKFDMALIELDGSHDISSLLDPDYFISYTSSGADAARTELDNAATNEQYAQSVANAAQTMVKDQPIIWAYEETPMIAYHTNISGIPDSMVDTYLPLAQITKK